MADAFIARAFAQHQRAGKQRDSAALEFFLGAATALEGQPEQQQVLFAATMISVRGFKFLLENCSDAKGAA